MYFMVYTELTLSVTISYCYGTLKEYVTYSLNKEKIGPIKEEFCLKLAFLFLLFEGCFPRDGNSLLENLVNS
jgi:hypothetical protein